MQMKCLVIALASTLTIGCAPQKPKPGQYTGFISTVGGLVEASGKPGPAPTPTPAPGKCENCNGTGKLGDGTITVPCPVCGGDGRTDNDPPKIEPVPVPAELPVTPPKPPTEEQKSVLRQEPAEPAYESRPRQGIFRRFRGGGGG